MVLCLVLTVSSFFLFFKFYFIFNLYIIVLVLSNIKMNPPQEGSGWGTHELMLLNCGVGEDS